MHVKQTPAPSFDTYLYASAGPWAALLLHITPRKSEAQVWNAGSVIYLIYKYANDGPSAAFSFASSNFSCLFSHLLPAICFAVF